MKSAIFEVWTQHIHNINNQITARVKADVEVDVAICIVDLVGNLVMGQIRGYTLQQVKENLRWTQYSLK